MNKALFAARAWLPQGWAENVRVEIDAHGTIAAVQVQAAADGAAASLVRASARSPRVISRCCASRARQAPHVVTWADSRPAAASNEPTRRRRSCIRPVPQTRRPATAGLLI